MQINDRPRLRPLEAQELDEPGRSGILLTDPIGLCTGQVFVPRGLLPILTRFTGEATVAEIAKQLSVDFGQDVRPEDVLQVANDLDERVCLEGERAEAAMRARIDGFAALEARPARHAGSAGYPAETNDCRRRLDEMLDGKGQREAGATAPALRGLVAPHIDLARGEAGYRAAYARLRESEAAELYVLFGTSHRLPRQPLVPTRKNFDTPIGRVETDVAFVESVASALGEDCWDDELLHLEEHSLEFQVLFLRHCLGDRDFKIAPFLTGRLDKSPHEDEYIQGAVAALRTAISQRGSERVCVIGGADLAHLGPFFGDTELVAEPLLAQLADRDRKSLAHLEQGDRASFFDDVEGDGNSRRICGTVPIWLVAELAGGPAELLHYGQAAASDGSQVVSHCSLAFGSV